MREDRSVWRCEICSDSAFNNGVSEITSNREVFLRRTAGSASSSVSLSSLMQETTEQTNTVYRRHPLGFALRSCWTGQELRFHRLQEPDLRSTPESSTGSAMDTRRVSLLLLLVLVSYVSHGEQDVDTRGEWFVLKLLYWPEVRHVSAGTSRTRHSHWLDPNNLMNTFIF